MTAWPGGPCPECGDDMPSNLIHCQRCRALLNPSLKPSQVEIPDFIPLRELDSPEQMKEDPLHISTQGYYCSCPHCHKELKVGNQFQNQKVSCKFCNKDFVFDANNMKLKVSGVALHCPQCSNKLRVAVKYLGLKVLCNFCSQILVIHEQLLKIQD